MSYRGQNMGDQLLSVSACPHCGTANPTLVRRWHSEHPTSRADGGVPEVWSCYACTTCGSIVSARGIHRQGRTPILSDIYPDVWVPDESLPERVALYLRQCKNTLANPDASVVMAASAIDAMLKDNELRDGPLFTRIDEAASKGIITQSMAKWAHRVRLDANNPRHADEKNPHLTNEDALRAFQFADALATVLYVLPSRMPAGDEASDGQIKA